MTNSNSQWQNADQNEIDKFTISDSWWNTNGAFKPLHDINPIRLAFIQHHAQLKQQQILDVGCGGGILSEALAKAGANVTGLDLNSNAIEQAVAHAKLQDLPINYQLQAVEQLSHEKHQFDIVVCMELLEHVPDPQSIVNACVKLTKPNGKLFFATINRNPKAFLTAIVGAEYLLQLLPKGTHDYQKFIKPSELSKWLRKAGSTVIAMSGMHYNPLNKQFSLAENIDVNYLLCAQKC